MQGHQRLVKPQVEVIVKDGVEGRASRRHYVRAHVEWSQGRFIAHITGNQGSHIMTSLRNANALLIISENSAAIPPGGTTKAMMLDWPEEKLTL